MTPLPQSGTLAALSGVPFVMVLGNSMLIPVLPAMAGALGLSALHVSLVITLFSVPAGLVIPLAGFLSDRLGRKAVIVPGLLLYGLGGLLAGLAAALHGKETFAAVLTGRVLQGIGAAGTAPLAMALAGDLFQGRARSRALGIIEAANGFGKVLSPVLGAALGSWAWFAPFFLFPALCVLAAGAVGWAVKEPGAHRAPPSLGRYKQMLRQIFARKVPLLASGFAAGMGALLLLFGVLFYLSEHLEKAYGLEGVAKGLALAVPVLFMCGTSFLSGLVAKKQVARMKFMVVAGLLIIAAGLIGLVWVRHTWLHFAVISLIGVGTGLVLPCVNTLITGAARASERGLITALYGSVRFFGVAAGPPLFGLLLERSLAALFLLAGAGAGLVALLAQFLIRVGEIQKN